MLFVLKKVQGEDLCEYFLQNGKEYVVGRKGANILITKDQSISRKHAVIKIVDNKVIVIDCGAKYNTFYQRHKLEANVETVIQDGEEIKFGVFESVYRIHRAVIITTGSGLNAQQKNELKENITSLGGSVVNNWTPRCTHLTVEEITLTLKVLHALIDNKPIVKLKYWSELLKSVKNQSVAPQVEDFRPPVAEPLLNVTSISVDPKRKTLFKGTVFVFPNEKSMSRMSEIIEKTGGKCISWTQKSLPWSEIEKGKNKYIFIHNDDIKDVDKSLKDVYKKIVSSGKRTIPIQEIAMAILLCSCEKDCNPNFNRAEQVFVKQHGDPLQSQDYCLAPETPSQYGPVNTLAPKQEVDIPASYDMNHALTTTATATTSDRNILDVALGGGQPTTSSTTQPLLKNENAAMDYLDITSSMKRPAGENSQGDSEAKRIKLEEDEAVVVVAEKQDTGPPPAVSTDATPNEESSRKRKAEEDLADSPSKVPNPFAQFKRRTANKPRVTDENNPFASLRIERKLPNADPEENTRVANKDRRATVDVALPSTSAIRSVVSSNKSLNTSRPSVTNEKNDHNNKSSNSNARSITTRTSSTDSVFSSNSDVDCSSVNLSKKFNRTGWLTKNNCPNISRAEIDEELQNVFDRFKNTVIVERASLLRKDLPPKKGNGAMAPINGMQNVSRNFKKFKKIQPLRPQTNIITTVDAKNMNLTNSNTTLSGTTTTDTNGYYDDDDDEDEIPPSRMPPPAPPKRTVQKKRFNF